MDSTTAFTACTSPQAYSNLAVGAHTFRVRARDAAGNLDGSPAAYAWTIQSGGTVNCGTPQTVAAVADAWIEQSSPSSNRGTDSILKVMSKSGNSNLRALVRFTLPSMPAGCIVDTATLRLYAGSAANGRTLQAIRLNATWNETSVSWSNQPATTGTAATTTSGTGYRQWNVAAMVQAMYSSGAAHGFLVRDATEGQDAEQQFYSREKGEQPPQLVITFKAASGGVVGGPIGTGGPLWQAIRLAPAPVDPIVLVATQVTSLAALVTVTGFLLAPRAARRPPGPPLGA
jgi:hypothetical protein